MSQCKLLQPLLRSMLLLSSVALVGFAPAASPTEDGAARVQPATASLIDQALAAPHRSEASRARDVYRNPRETLLFFGLEPDMTVVEIMPGAGWYSEILAPVLRDRGTYFAAHHDPSAGDYAKRGRANFEAKIAANPVYDQIRLTSFGKDHLDTIAPAGSADLVLTFRNVHNWLAWGDGRAVDAFRAFHRALKPGGVLGVVEHRLPEDRPTEAQRISGYMKTSEVIRLAEAAGFKLVDQSEINANPKDTADHPSGVWTLPPSFRLGDQDREKYAAIGESDRMTLKFVKPAS